MQKSNTHRLTLKEYKSLFNRLYTSLCLFANKYLDDIEISKDNFKILNDFSKIKNKGSRIWVNSLWGALNANHDDDKAVNNLDNIYGWYINKGVNMIQTDRPEMLLNYLMSKNLHN